LGVRQGLCRVGSNQPDVLEPPGRGGDMAAESPGRGWRSGRRHVCAPRCVPRLFSNTRSHRRLEGAGTGLEPGCRRWWGWGMMMWQRCDGARCYGSGETGTRLM
jgi:hypothetical protein